MSLLRLIVFAAGSLFVVGSLHAGDSDEAKQSVEKHAIERDGCGLDHGYVCGDLREDNFLSAESLATMQPGNYFKAWQVALVDFMAIEDLALSRKNLKDYKIGFSENPTQYVVHFQPLLLPGLVGGEISGLSRDTLGRSTRYWINKGTMAIDRRLFYK